MFQLKQSRWISHSSKMDHFETDNILKSFSIIVDTREQVTPRAKKRYSDFGVEYTKGILDYGDYTYNLNLPSGKLHNVNKRIRGKCVIERKQNLDELAMCFTRSRDRFRREFLRATEADAKVYLLIENASLDMLLKGQYRSRFKPQAFIASLMAWAVRYNMTPIFCEMEHSGRIIKEVLYRDCKERLEGGEFDAKL